DVSPLPLIDPVHGLPAADDQQCDVRLILADLGGPADRPAVAFGSLLQGMAEVAIWGAAYQAATDDGVVKEGESRCGRQVVHPGPPDRITEHRNGEWPVRVSRARADPSRRRWRHGGNRGDPGRQAGLAKAGTSSHRNHHQRHGGGTGHGGPRRPPAPAAAPVMPASAESVARSANTTRPPAPPWLSTGLRTTETLTIRCVRR